MRAGARVWIVVGSLAAFGAAWETPAHAQVKGEKAAADQRARELFQKGDTAYAEGRYEEALAAFQEAYDLSGRPQLLFNVSNALERLGRYEEAVDALEKYLASGKARDRDVVQKRLANLKKRVEEQRKEQEQKAKEEQEREERQAEERRKREAAAASSPRETSPDRPAPPREEASTPVLPIVLLGTGAAALAAGGVFGFLTLGARSDAKDACRDAPTGLLCEAEARSALDREKTFGLVADISLVSGIVLGGAGLYLLLSSGKAPDRAAVPSAPVRVVGRPGGGGIEVVGSF